ncbi:MAG TPA: thioesterase domain-containing protein, partial [Thermoleophilaceae bacterium]
MNYGDGGSGPGGVASATPWVVRFDPRPTAAVRLICLPHAGAGASMYLRWSRALPDWVEVVAVQLSGRETRRREPLRHAAGELVEDLA